MKINIQKCLEFLDNPSVRGHATAIVGVIGEELNACAFKYYMDEKGNQTKILLEQNQKNKPIRVTQGTLRGKRLDRWIEVKENGKKILYQCEIKNWSATAIGGRYLKVGADEVEIKNAVKYYWSRQVRTEFSNTKYPSGVTKVFVEMKPPEGYLEVRPLLIYWMPISSSNNLEPFSIVSRSSFKNPAIKTKFKKLYIFSVSLYFRKLLRSKKKIIDFDMPDSQHRIKILKSLGVL